MARKKAKTDWDNPSAIEAFLSEQLGPAVLALDGFEDSASAAAADVGLPLDHLCLRYFFQRTTFALERTMILFGPTGSNKTTVMYWFYDLFRRHGGRYLHVDMEDKDTPLLRLSMTDYDAGAGWVRPCATLDEGQAKIDQLIAAFKGLCDKKNGPGRRTPLVVGVDSLTAKMTADARAVVEKNHGVVERRFADEARSLSDWFKYVPNLLQGWPISLIGISHDKPKPATAPGMPPTHQTPGGAAPGYYATYKILVQKTKRNAQKADGWEGNRLKLTMEKNSLGTDKLHFEVDVRWAQVPGLTKTGKEVMTQVTELDWHAATTELLCRMGTDDKFGGTARSRLVDDTFQVRKQNGGLYSAAGIGVPASDPVTATELGRMIEARRDLLDVVEPRLGIHPSRVFRRGVDFSVQVAEARATVDDLIPCGVVIREPDPTPADAGEDEPDE